MLDQEDVVLRAERVIVVDDDEISLGEKVSSLRLGGFDEVIEFINPVKILDQIDRLWPFDLLITDWQMDPVDGIELIDELRSLGLEFKVLLVSKVADKPSGYNGAFLKKEPLPEKYESSLLVAVLELLGSH